MKEKHYTGTETKAFLKITRPTQITQLILKYIWSE